MHEKPNRIYELRHKHGISQERLAEELNVSRASVSLYENGSNIPVDILKAIAEYFGITIDYLLKRTHDYRNKNEKLSDGEYNLIAFYRRLPSKYRRLIDDDVQTLSEKN